MQHAKITTGEECKTKTLERVKVQHEIEQFIKRMQLEKKCNMKTLIYKKVQHGAVWKWCSVEMVQCEKSET